MKGIDCAMVYRCPGEQLIHGVKCESLVVKLTEVEAKLAEGWCRTPQEAQSPGPKAAAKPVFEPVPSEDAPPTREEMLRKAWQLGVKVDGRWSDKRLLDEIEGKL